jgi:hypothetical protein
MGEGHSFDQCPNLILPSVEWAYDVNAQAIERVHRLTSQKPVNIYCFVTKGTIDEKLAAVFAEKGDSSDLALDGKLSEKVTEELNLADLLNAAIENFSPNQETIDEHTLIAAYPTTILPRLLSAQETWRSQNAATPIIAAPVNNVTKVKTVTTPAPAPAPAPVTNKLTILLRNPAFSRFLASA